jgi:hypothetical protein
MIPAALGLAEEPDEDEAHSIFALPSLDTSRAHATQTSRAPAALPPCTHACRALPLADRELLQWLIVGLIAVTILYERITEWLEVNVFNEGIRAALWQKILRELTILGFVSFTATIALQFAQLEEEPKMIFEFAHVLMFTLAIMYAKEISISAVLFTGIKASFVAADEESEEDLLRMEREWVARAEASSGLRSTYARSTLLNTRLRKLAASSKFKVLRFHFMARCAPSPSSPSLPLQRDGCCTRAGAPRGRVLVPHASSRLIARARTAARGCWVRRALSGRAT